MVVITEVAMLLVVYIDANGIQQSIMTQWCSAITVMLVGDCCVTFFRALLLSRSYSVAASRERVKTALE